MRTGSAEDAFAIRKVISDSWDDIVLPAVERAFNESVVDGMLVRIPRLQLRIEVTSVNAFLEDLPALISSQLRECLLSRAMTAGQMAEPWEQSTEREDWFEVFVHYLRTGDLPWHQRSQPNPEVIEALTSMALIQARKILDRLPLAATPDVSALAFRWLQLIPDSSWLAIAELLFMKESSRRRALIVEGITLLSAAPSGNPERYIRLRVASALIAEGASATTDPEIEELVSLIRVLGLGIRSGVEDRVIRSVLSRLPELRTVFPGIAIPATRGDTSDVLRSANRPGKDEPTKMVSPLPGILDHQQGFAGGGTSEDKPFPLSVSHAGIVLLHPYLKRLFEALQMKQPGEEHLKPDALPRAAALLHYLATGREDVYEFELGLIKVLLGLRPETPLLVSAGLLSPDFREECETLLLAAIKHWGVLKNTSVAGLRASFLERRGFLIEEDDGWRLQVESRSFDVLLAHLPWTISVIVLSWMPKPIHTDWRTA